MRRENMAKPTWNDICNEKPSELMKHYKLTEKQMGQVVRNHSNDIQCASERRKFYGDVYDNNKKR